MNWMCLVYFAICPDLRLNDLRGHEKKPPCGLQGGSMRGLKNEGQPKGLRVTGVCM